MLKIHQKQVVAFEEANLESFTLAMAQHLRRSLTPVVARLDEGALLSSVRARLTQALSYGITDRHDLLGYLECSYVLGWQDDRPDDESQSVLARRDLTAAERIDLIGQRTTSL